MMFGDLPPISSVTLALRRAASEAIAWPVAVDPVNAIFATSLWATSAAPVLAPPVTTLTTPSGIPASPRSSANRSVEVGVTSDGLMTTVLPAARAGKSFHASRPSGVFQGVIAANHAHRLTQCKGGESGARGWHRGSSVRLCKACEEPAVARDRSHAWPHLRDELPVLEDLLVDESFGFPFDQIGETEQISSPLACEAARPAPVRERAGCSLDRGIDVGGIGIGDAAPIGLSKGIVRSEARPAVRGAPLSIDEEGKAGLRLSARAQIEDWLSTHWLIFVLARFVKRRPR